MNALALFRSGHDTEQISRILRISEAEALKQVTSQRSAQLGKSSPYRGDRLNLSVLPERYWSTRR